jgi:uncharacterized ion transporter superfamily protein YfcC
MKTRRWVLVLLAVPFVAVLWPPFYAGAQPDLDGIPFFIWYQFAWAIISAVLTIVVYLVWRPADEIAGGPADRRR